ncbi:hypothetical protein B0H10DRAFT_404701 [Mycena sp. CBHHK59/15]|nr:hypothetical protein B0H10DRAFT_404701 [Mycena sp. CBHHK59/15]
MAEKQISAIDGGITRLQDAINSLKRRRADILSVSNNHRGVVSALRRVPSEILSEIFAHCVDAAACFSPQNAHPWIITRVCSGWRAVSLASPRLWSNLVLVREPYQPMRRKKGLPHRVRPLLARLSAAGAVGSVRVPLSLHLERAENYTPDILELVFAASARWHKVTLDLERSNLELLRTVSDRFPSLKTLDIRSRLSEVPDGLFQSLPVLDDLELHLAYLSLPLHLETQIPWIQLRKCHLHKCSSADALWVLATASSLTDFRVSESCIVRDEDAPCARPAVPEA